ncbi:dihydrolipoamide dehydrogenase [miscellaneous Crenarchaeota group-1 archaeon SG8-32-3]|uniref:Dihydrolipoamide dehydrogenase n=1 Tax=miscellaneous Crenarchaeota group-1 archaeon SG8-32-3 TaxID=1685125 RepID=A0A0M0BRB5_9ARCH|nr:MAG: dihydrolipoamide dehydrogenase [miscellaneous Crenarchaeota group-1 archaeon SG8-32-3]
MKRYDLILIGTGSGMEVVAAITQENPNLHAAVIDKDAPGGICLTRGCIPSKLLIYPASIVRNIEKNHEFGIHTEIKRVDFKAVMKRMRSIVDRDVNMIREGISQSGNIDYYTEEAEFIAPYTIKVGKETITSKMIFLSTGSRPSIPPIEGLKETGYLTSDTILNITQLPRSIAIIGGGYIAAEYGHFLSAMGSKVTIIGRNPQFIPEEEPEVSALAKRELGKHVTILTNHEVRKAKATPQGKKLVAVDRFSKEGTEIVAEEILVATGRVPNTDLLHPEKAGIKTDRRGFMVADEYMQTSQPNIWVLGDADGKFLFKHVANHEAHIVYYNAVLKKRIKMDYHAVPHAVFTDPEIASVALREKEAVEKYGKDNILIGFYKYADTAKGEAMALKDDFVKVIVKRDTGQILGAHIIGPEASVLIQEVITLMYTENQSLTPLVQAMHIHPALGEVVARAFQSFMTPDRYHHFLEEHSGLPLE